jgi:antitoxin HicB
MQVFAYPATLTPASAFAEGETGFVVTFAALPEAIAQGENEAEALAQAADALEEAIAARIKRGDDIPAATAGNGIMVPVPTQTALKAALYLALRGTRGSQSGLAARMVKDEKQVRRLLDPHHRSRPRSIERALQMLGKRVSVVVEDA